MNPLWLEYRLDALKFDNGRTVDFPASSRMLYNPTHNQILLELTPAARRQLLMLIPLGSELREICYAMLVDLPGIKKTLGFYHPLGEGSGVRLDRFEGRSELGFEQESGRPLFSKKYTLRDVSGGKIDSDRSVWQFTGWRHEH